jgi:acyl carrier protein
MMGTLKTLGQICDYLSASECAKETCNGPANNRLPGADSQTIQLALLDIVGQLTGYPVEMLGLEMDIESDLGIDSIKRVEILSALEEKMPQLPQVTPEMMGTLKTLSQICQYLTAGTPSGTSIPVARDETESEPEPACAITDKTRTTLLEIVSHLTGYPIDMLGLEMDIESDLGIDSIKRVEILSALEEKVPELPKVTPDLMGTLKTLGQIVDYLNSSNKALCFSSGEPKHNSRPTIEPIRDTLASSVLRLDRRIIQTRSIAVPKGNPWIPPQGCFIGVAGTQNGVHAELINALNDCGIEAISLSDPDQLAAGLPLAGLVLLSPLDAPQAFVWAKACGPFLNAPVLLRCRHWMGLLDLIVPP